MEVYTTKKNNRNSNNKYSLVVHTHTHTRTTIEENHHLYLRPALPALLHHRPLQTAAPADEHTHTHTIIHTHASRETLVAAIVVASPSVVESSSSNFQFEIVSSN